MSDPERWAKTDPQIALLQEAKTYGDRCAACGRELDDAEPVFLESLAIGTKRLWLNGPVRPRSHTLAPVGRECASSELLQHAEGRMPERCARCGRGIVDVRPQPEDRRLTCSRRCSQRAAATPRGSPGPAAAPKVVRAQVNRERGRRPKKATRERKPVARESFGTRLKRLREARGLSRADLANACVGARRQPGPDDIMNYEDGSIMPAVHTFAAIARALCVSMEVLLVGEEEAAQIAAERAETPSG